ncbi:glycosyltransferase [Flavisolibacter sp. BT320]|nr:glycosyltransferase [Flavisolibacter longurius]
MNVVILSHDLPYPANHGFRVDMYNRIISLKKLNHKVFLIAWTLYEDNRSDNSIEHMKAIVDGLICVSRSESVIGRTIDIAKKSLNLFFQPSVVTQCSFDAKYFKEILEKLRLFKPDAFFIESIYCAKLGFKYSNILNAPVFIRSHNIEHLYIKDQIKKATTLKIKAKYFAMSCNLKSYEMKMLQKAKGFFDISLADLDYWKKLGISNGYWMPPIYNASEGQPLSNLSLESDFDIAYIGNLCMPNNIEAVIWFIKSSLPGIRAKFPNIKVLIAGSKPTNEIIEICSREQNITLIQNPIEVSQFFKSTKVLINPILFGSGVNIKSIEMLHLAKNVVCTRKAISGLPKEIEEVFCVTDRDHSFSEAIIDILSGSNRGSFTEREDLLAYFSIDYLDRILRKMESSSM